MAQEELILQGQIVNFSAHQQGPQDEPGDDSQKVNADNSDWLHFAPAMVTISQ